MAEAFRKAAASGNLEELKSIVSGANPRQNIVTLDFYNSKDNDGCTALWHAANNGHTEIVYFLVNQCGVDMLVANVSPIFNRVTLLTTLLLSLVSILSYFRLLFLYYIAIIPIACLHCIGTRSPQSN